MMAKYERLDKKAMAVLIGNRMKEAREKCRFSQENAARRLGFKNSSQLSKLENAIDSRVPSIARLIEIGRLYGVTTDFLLGLTENWDVDDKEDARKTVIDGVNSQLCEIFDAEQRVVKVSIMKMQSQVNVLSSVIENTVTEAANIKGALDRVSELNSEFEDLKGGARLVRLITDFQENALNSAAMLRRFNMKSSAAKGFKQVDIFCLSMEDGSKA